MSLKFQKNFIVLGVIAWAAIGLAGCGGVDDVQLNGKIFDAVGFNSSGTKKTPQLATRSPLIVPPGLEKLPEPGSGAPSTTASIDGVQDHDAKRQTSQDDLERQQVAYCKVHYEDAKIHGDQDAVLATGPLGPCQQSAFSALKNLTKGDSGQ